MKTKSPRTVLFLLVSLVIFCSNVHPDEKGAVTKAMVHPDYVWKRIHIEWGIKTKTKQVWDGHAEIDAGYILKINPFIRRDLLDDSKLVTETSWKSETYSDVEGIFLTVYAPPAARIQIITETHPFSFTVADIQQKQRFFEMEGDIEISDQTEDLLFRIQGLEYGKTGSGSATISPAQAYVDTVGTWTLTYTAGGDGIPVGGGIRISWHFTRSWGRPQFINPQAVNFVTAKTTGSATLDYQSEHRGLFEYPFTQGRILVRVLNKPLKPGEQIIVVLGDTTGGSPGFRTPVISEKDFNFRVESCTEVPEAGFPVYRRLKELPELQIKTNLPPTRFFAVAPSTVKLNQPFVLKLVAEDKYRNTVETFTGDVTLSAQSTSGTVPLGTFTFTKNHPGTLKIENLKLPSEGIWHVVIEGKRGLAGQSNPILCQADTAFKLFWGELHGHTAYSDGYGTAEDYFTFARSKAVLDFAAITDHDVELDAPDHKVSEMWKEVNKAVVKFNKPPTFLTLLAYEWSPARITETTKEPYGDHNIFYFQNKGYIFPTGDVRSNTLQKLYRRLKELPLETLVKVIPHVGGAIGNWDIHDPDLEPLGEIYSVHGSFEQFGQIALDKGYRIGFVGAADAHNGQIGGFPPGNSANHFVHGGLTGLYAKELTRKALYDAISARRVFATTGNRMIVDFTINGHRMGEDITVNGAPEIKAFAVGEQPIWKIDLIKNGQVIHTEVNSFEQKNVVTLLWQNQVERDDLLDFEKGFWSRRLRGVQWRGTLHASAGGLRLLAPCSFDYPKDRILTAGADSVVWQSETRGDYDGLRVEVQDLRAPLAVTMGARAISTVASAAGFLLSGQNSQQQTLHFTPDAIPAAGRQIQIGPSDFITVLKGEPAGTPLRINFTDHDVLKPDNYYYVRVTQIDGEMAWSSPIWLRVTD